MGHVIRSTLISSTDHFQLQDPLQDQTFKSVKNMTTENTGPSNIFPSLSY